MRRTTFVLAVILALSTLVAPPRLSGGDQRGTPGGPSVLIGTALSDEDTHRARIREEIRGEVAGRYSLLLEDLNVTPKQAEDLISHLVDSQVAATTKVQMDDRTAGVGTIVVRGEPMSAEDRAQGIAAIIGDAKLQEFLALERNLPAYSEVQALGSLLHRKDVPLTHTQRDRLLEQLIQTRAQYLVTTKPVESIEDFERLIAAQDEYERHVLELAPSVLSPGQVPFIADQYQQWSQLRMRNLEVQRKRVEEWKAASPDEKPMLLIPDL